MRDIYYYYPIIIVIISEFYACITIIIITVIFHILHLIYRIIYVNFIAKKIGACVDKYRELSTGRVRYVPLPSFLTSIYVLCH